MSGVRTENMRANGRTIRCMALVRQSGLMVGSMRGST